MMGACVLRTASGNVTEYLQVKGEPEEWRLFSNCTERSCPYGLHNDNQVCLIVLLLLINVTSSLSIVDIRI
jgi:hypothetical protein